jgi:hypothetical protein
VATSNLLEDQMAIEKVYKTSDGECFTTWREARKHESQVAGPEAEFRAWCGENFCTGAESASEISDAILEHFEPLKPRKKP